MISKHMITYLPAFHYRPCTRVVFFNVYMCLTPDTQGRIISFMVLIHVGVVEEVWVKYKFSANEGYLFVVDMFNLLSMFVPWFRMWFSKG